MDYTARTSLSASPFEYRTTLYGCDVGPVWVEIFDRPDCRTPPTPDQAMELGPSTIAREVLDMDGPCVIWRGASRHDINGSLECLRRDWSRIHQLAALWAWSGCGRTSPGHSSMRFLAERLGS
jgi:hypothetical protein